MVLTDDVLVILITIDLCVLVVIIIPLAEGESPAAGSAQASQTLLR